MELAIWTFCKEIISFPSNTDDILKFTYAYSQHNNYGTLMALFFEKKNAKKFANHMGILLKFFQFLQKAQHICEALPKSYRPEGQPRSTRSENLSQVYVGRG